MTIKIIQRHLEHAVAQLYPQHQSDLRPSVDYSDNPQFGELSSNVALHLAPTVKQSPRVIAEAIATELRKIPEVTRYLEQISVDGPGYLNFRINSEGLWQSASQYLEVPQHHPDQPGHGQKVMVEYSSPNIAKPFNVGHLRSTIIGESIARMHQYLGYTVLRDNHLGDWGTQYGKLAVAVETWGDWDKIEANPIPELFQLYVRFHQEEETNLELANQGRDYFRRLEQGDAEAKATWQRLVDLSLIDFNQLYDQLDVHFDSMLGEAFYEPMLDSVIQLAIDQGVAKESQGAWLVFFDEPGLKDHPLMIRKSDGTSTYATRDLAGIRYRLPEYQLDRLVIEIGNEQELYFRQVIRAAEMLNLAKPGQLVHVGHGLFLLPEGKMSTRKGQTIWLRDLITELEQQAQTVVTEKSPDLTMEQQQQIARTVAMGALKYNDLSQNRNSNVVFDKDKSLNLDGNSAPYLQYSIARARSVLAKAEEQGISIDHARLLSSALGRSQPLETAERELLSWLIRFDDVVVQANREYLPSSLATYLFNVAQKFSSFYQAAPILQSDDDVKSSRLLLTIATMQVLTKGLDLLGIKVPVRM